MGQKKLGRNIQTRVKNFIQYMIESKSLHRYDEAQFFEMLSQNLREEIIGEVNGKVLMECSIFHTNFSRKAGNYLSHFMKEGLLSPEQMIFEVIPDYLK